MEIICQKVRRENQLSFTVELSEQEINAFKRYGDEIKCYLLNQENKYLDTNNYIFSDVSFDEYPDIGILVYEFIYYNREDTDLVLTFLITFTKNEFFKINPIILKHNDEKYIKKYANKMFRDNTSNHVKDIIELLLNRIQGFYCDTCFYKHQFTLSRQCLYIYKKTKK